ncbi:MAG TPA: Hpt domain-containing protein [Rhizomicrobium sp.]|nr:Hpt domain-containing protein [Rhizomicrobium sp.]
MPQAAQARPVDLDHLARYTGGDVALNSEVLGLFANQSVELIAKLQSVLDTGDLKTWKEITHSLKGAARGIGAFGFADAAANAEPVEPVPGNIGAIAALQALRRESEIVQRFIESYLAR